VIRQSIQQTELETIKNLYLIENRTVKEIAEHYQYSKQAVFNFLKRNNIPIKNRKQVNTEVASRKEFQDRRRLKMVGKPSGALGCKWKLKYRRFCPYLIGDKNPMWKGGKTKLSLCIRELPEYKEWRRKIFDRDWFTCQFCGRCRKKGDRVIIHADHIVRLADLIDDYQIKNIYDAVKCNELWDINNGRTLCRECHKQTITWGVNKYKIRRKNGLS
jgi:hypothetical protein